MSTFDDLDKLKSLRQKVDWEIESERCELLNQLYPVVENWKGKLPNLRDIFHPEEIDWLLTEAVKCNKHEDKPEPLVEFVASSGYKDEPEAVEDDKPSSRRTTPIHHAARCPLRNRCIVRELFKVYDRFDVNYTDELEFSHFHVACMYSCVDVVKKFLELGQDPDCLAQKSVDPPLHFALKNGDEELVGLLLRNGADPNMADAEGSTPLHTICKKNDDDSLAKMLFEISDEKHQLVQMDTKDKLGRTPLQLAVKRIVCRQKRIVCRQIRGIFFCV
ncbi:unnamed protein product [Trichogramma brassicae]|uniref:Uncharacterized protein n=1 Tax=Trichogramma brassicae TaxID=86971 RepID=A0A6H5J8P4_9HYME|nr:unnamed protein product [Trichogramma brassicae]